MLVRPESNSRPPAWQPDVPPPVRGENALEAIRGLGGVWTKRGVGHGLPYSLPHGPPGEFRQLLELLGTQQLYFTMMRTINKADLSKRPAKRSQNAKRVLITYQFPAQL